MKNVLGFSKVKLIANVFVALALVLLVIYLPSSGIRDTFAQLATSRKILSFVVSYILSFIFYYPLTASLIYLGSAIKNKTYLAREIIWAILFIIVFNPWTLSCLFKEIFPGTTAQPAAVSSGQPTCGLMINDFAAGSKAQAAGLKMGDKIVSVNGVTVNSVQDIFAALADKKPGDKVEVGTNQLPKMVELVTNPSDPNQPALGVKLVASPCK